MSKSVTERALTEEYLQKGITEDRAEILAGITHTLQVMHLFITKDGKENIYYGALGSVIYIVQFLDNGEIGISCAPVSNLKFFHWMMRGQWNGYFEDAILAAEQLYKI